MQVKQFYRKAICLGRKKKPAPPRGGRRSGNAVQAYLATKLSFSVTMRLNTGLPGVESTRSATK